MPQRRRGPTKVAVSKHRQQVAWRLGLIISVLDVGKMRKIGTHHGYDLVLNGRAKRDQLEEAGKVKL